MPWLPPLMYGSYPCTARFVTTQPQLSKWSSLQSVKDTRHHPSILSMDIRRLMPPLPVAPVQAHCPDASEGLMISGYCHIFMVKNKAPSTKGRMLLCDLNNPCIDHSLETSSSCFPSSAMVVALDGMGQQVKVREAIALYSTGELLRPGFHLLAKYLYRRDIKFIDKFISSL